jgi:hypothetical protein
MTLSRKQTGLVIGGLAAAAGLVLAVTLVRPNPEDPGPPSTSDPTILSADPSTLAASPHLLFRHAGIDASYNHMSVAPIAEPNARRGVTELQCERVSFAAGRGICLKADRGVFTTYEAVLFDDRFQHVRSIKLDGSPSRTRIASDGRFGAITVFVTSDGHGYASLGAFLTKTVLLDMATGDVLGDLEQFTTWRDGERFSAKDFNFWGVTFARDSNAFYASLQSEKRTYLVRGDLARRSLTVLHENVECPSLSPDNRLVAYKKRVGTNLFPWRFYVLDLATMTDRPIAAETRSIDDQIEWFDDAHVLYAVPRSSQSVVRDVWIAPIDGSGPARSFLARAESPVVVR